MQEVKHVYADIGGLLNDIATYMSKETTQTKQLCRQYIELCYTKAYKEVQVGDSRPGNHDHKRIKQVGRDSRPAKQP